ncbi:AbrB/MazE/SpoVT family DNA-binding domain-containing protein [Bordetella genomosp. 13]|uniref:AbrB/MazE/SpoVT family DNA-binding domain-containing protein n=1 Tax=Bordetella genomosp. 13 TaxID=463040 RepID=A0A1W6ZCQ4_9BORD|nr:AbrB/MazE/SpoVT family DNA-binding domain-containing protein [Bordetella genomosp. 13]ARP94920.1 AbrB/MazE/SpoVT family DNA-binding domain-containing protein [Bordetella genomosp. 13]
MDLLVAKWGNSLALRIPADYARSTGLKEGDRVEASLTVDGGISLRTAKWNRKAFALQLQQMRESMPEGESVIDELRRGGRY